MRNKNYAGFFAKLPRDNTLQKDVIGIILHLGFFLEDPKPTVLQKIKFYCEVLLDVLCYSWLEIFTRYMEMKSRIYIQYTRHKVSETTEKLYMAS